MDIKFVYRLGCKDCIAESYLNKGVDQCNLCQKLTDDGIIRAKLSRKQWKFYRAAPKFHHPLRTTLCPNYDRFCPIIANFCNFFQRFGCEVPLSPTPSRGGRFKIPFFLHQVLLLFDMISSFANLKCMHIFKILLNHERIKMFCKCK